MNGESTAGRSLSRLLLIAVIGTAAACAPRAGGPAGPTGAPAAGAPAAAAPADGWPRAFAGTPEPGTRPADEHPADDAVAPPWGRPRTDDVLPDEDDDLDDEPSRRLHPYTWLHVLVLAVVAFVLGFLIMLLVIETRGGEPGAAAAAVTGWVAGRAGPL